jgi:hypothetical protein
MKEKAINNFYIKLLIYEAEVEKNNGNKALSESRTKTKYAANMEFL